MNRDEIFKLIEIIGTQAKPAKTSRSIVFSCPFSPWKHQTGGDSHPSFSIDIRDGEQSFCRCFTCDTYGPVEEVLSEYAGLVRDPMLYAKIPWIEKVNSPDLENRLRRAIEASTKPPDGFVQSYKTFPDSEFKKFEGSVPEYALDRGLTLETCKRWRLGYDKTEYAPRLVFTVRDWKGRLVGMVGRAIRNDTEPKYKNYWGFPRSELLYGEHFHNEPTKPLVLVEGMLDTILLDQWFSSLKVMGIFGNRITKLQAQKILQFADIGPVYTMYDRDLGGDEARTNTDKMVGRGIAVIHSRLPQPVQQGSEVHDGKNDPAKAGPEVCQKVFEEVGLRVEFS